MAFPVGTRMKRKDTGQYVYQKTEDGDFAYWRSLKFDLDKPLEQRYGFKWTDQQTYDWFKNTMTFELPY